MKTLLSWMLFAVALALPPAAQADGCYMPVRATQKIPAITGQRALIVWKDGVETLVISSGLDSESQKLGWIIPVPAVPETIEKASPGAPRTLSFLLQPRITHDLFIELKTTFWLVLLPVLLVAVFLFRREDFGCLVWVLFGLLFFSAMLFPAFMTGGGAATVQTAAAHVEKTVRAGAYDISIVRAAKPEELNAWLGDNGFAALPAQAVPAVAGYIRDGWVFATVKLTRDEAGANTPHPIKLVFRAQSMIYPMKLTAIAGGAPSFELFTIADQRMASQELPEEFCDRFQRKRYHDGLGKEYEIADSFEGAGSEVRIGHPALCGLMWDGCVVTKLAGSISAQEMTQDLRFTAKPFAFRQRHLYTRAGAFATALIIWMALLGVTLVVTLVWLEPRIRQPWGGLWYFGRVVLPALAAASTCAWLFLVCAPKLPPDAVHFSRGGWARHFPSTLHALIAELFKENPGLAERDVQAIGDYVLTNAPPNRWQGASSVNTNKAFNAATREALRIEDSPGNFTVEKNATNVIVRVYEWNGDPMVLRVPIVNPGSNAK